MRKERERLRKKRRRKYIVLWILFPIIAAAVAGVAVYFISKEDNDAIDALLEQEVSIDYIEETEDACPVPRPDIDEQLLTVNEYSRPGIKTEATRRIVIHYLANPRTTAQENHDNFESLKDLEDTYMSANYVVGLEGEIIQCVPDDEVAYASNSENSESISIENCHLDDTGKLNEETYYSLVHLTAYLTEKYGLGREDIIRHYDVTGKLCPKYFVEHEDKWEEFKDDVMKYREECRKKAEEKAAKAEEKASETEDVLAEYLESALTETESE